MKIPSLSLFFLMSVMSVTLTDSVTAEKLSEDETYSVNE